MAETMNTSGSQAEQVSTLGAIILGPGDGRVIPGPDGITVKASGQETGGAIGFLEATTPPGASAPRHIHYSSDEMFYVLEGEFQFLVGERVVNATPGTFVFIPRGTVHAPKVVGTEPGKVLIAFIPGGQEQAFEEFAQLASAQGDDAGGGAAQAIAEKYDSAFVGPPL